MPFGIPATPDGLCSQPPTVNVVCVLRAGPPDLPLPNDTPDGYRPTFEGLGLDGGQRLVVVPLGTRSLRPLSSVHVLSAGPTSRPFPQRYAGRGPSDARGVRLGR